MSDWRALWERQGPRWFTSISASTAAKLKRAQKLLNAPTETETVERAIDMAILEHERNRIANLAHDRFVRSKATVRDVYGVLE